MAQTVEEIEAEIEKELAVKERLEEGLKTDKAALEEHRKKQKAAAYKALATNNTRAAKRLDQSESQLAKLTQRISSHEQAIETSTEKVAFLRERKAEAQRREQLERYEKGKADLMIAAADFEMKLSAFTEQKETIVEQFETLNRLSFGLYETDARPHKNVPRAFRWLLEQRLGIDTPYRDKGFRQRFRAPVPDIFNRIMRGELTTEETAGKADSKETAAIESDTEQGDQKASGE